MSSNEQTRASRRRAGAVLGGLAVGALVGVGVAAQPASADHTEHAATVADGQVSFADAFARAFTPGTITDTAMRDNAILIPDK